MVKTPQIRELKFGLDERLHDAETGKLVRVIPLGVPVLIHNTRQNGPLDKENVFFIDNRPAQANAYVEGMRTFWGKDSYDKGITEALVQFYKVV